MAIRILLIIAALAVGAALGALVPQVSDGVGTALRSVGLGSWTQHGHAHADDAHDKGGGKHAHGGKADGHGHEEGPEGVVKMPPERIAAAKIEVAPVGKGTLARRLSVPGTVAPDPDRIGRVAAKVVGTVAELNKRLGDTVAKGEVIAILDSREVAEAKSDYLGASVNFDLQKTLFEREQSLFQKNITAEQQFLRARTAFAEAQLRLDLARQKLFALGVGEKEIAGLSKATMQGLQRYEIRAPLAGRVVERKVDLGAPVGARRRSSMSSPTCRRYGSRSPCPPSIWHRSWKDSP